MADSRLRRWLGLAALAAVLAAGLYLFWHRLFPAVADEISRVEGQPELPAAKAAAGDWPWWRGPTLDNHSLDADAPTKWDETHNVIWKKPIPGRGHSTPILIGNRAILTTADESAGTQEVLALDRSDGSPLWRTVVHRDGLMGKHGANSHASGTPACDGERVFVQFLNSGAQWLSALDLAGHVLWQRQVGEHRGGGSHGSGPSPALWGSLVIVNGDAPQTGFVAAVHRQTGQIVWRKARTGRMGSYGSPLVAEWHGRPQVLLSGNEHLTSYDPSTGDKLWACPGLSHVSANTPVLAGDVVIGSTGAGDAMMAARPDGSPAWQTGRASDIPYASTPLYADGSLYLVSRQSRAVCIDPATGVKRWDEALRGEYWSSPLLVGKNLYVGSREGEVVVFEANPEEFVPVARNRVDAGVYASPVAVGSRLFIRTEQSLYCIGK